MPVVEYAIGGAVRRDTLVSNSTVLFIEGRGGGVFIGITQRFRNE